MCGTCFRRIDFHDDRYEARLISFVLFCFYLVSHSGFPSSIPKNSNASVHDERNRVTSRNVRLRKVISFANAKVFTRAINCNSVTVATTWDAVHSPSIVPLSIIHYHFDCLGIIADVSVIATKMRESLHLKGMHRIHPPGVPNWARGFAIRALMIRQVHPHRLARFIDSSFLARFLARD